MVLKTRHPGLFSPEYSFGAVERNKDGKGSIGRRPDICFILGVDYDHLSSPSNDLH